MSDDTSDYIAVIWTFGILFSLILAFIIFLSALNLMPGTHDRLPDTRDIMGIIFSCFIVGGIIVTVVLIPLSSQLKFNYASFYNKSGPEIFLMKLGTCWKMIILVVIPGAISVLIFLAIIALTGIRHPMIIMLIAIVLPFCLVILSSFIASRKWFKHLRDLAERALGSKA